MAQGTFDGTINTETVEKIHNFDDVDVRPESHHHTLGAAPNQAAPGSHLHRGGDSQILLVGSTLSGSRGSATAMVSIISALVVLGATDTTGP
jgi:hypothetical protein